MNKYKMATIDMDGTLLDSKSRITQRTADILREVDAAGCKIILCTGRIHHAIKPYAEQLGLDNYSIVGNGAQICRALSGEVVDEHLLSVEKLNIAVRAGRKYGGHPRVYGTDGRVYVDKLTAEDRDYSIWTATDVIETGDLTTYFTAPLVKVINVMPNHKAVEDALRECREIMGDSVFLTDGMMNFAECMNSLASKGQAVTKLADMCGVKLPEVIVAGDHHNDLPMFNLPGVLGITCANAQDAVKAAADKVGLSNDEDGIALLLQEIVLGK